jgi:hypothetical protein
MSGVTMHSSSVEFVDDWPAGEFPPPLGQHSGNDGAYHAYIQKGSETSSQSQITQASTVTTQ